MLKILFQINEEHVGLVMEALSHRRAEVVDMGPVPGHEGRTRLSMTCPSRLVSLRTYHDSPLPIVLEKLRISSRKQYGNGLNVFIMGTTTTPLSVGPAFTGSGEIQL